MTWKNPRCATPEIEELGDDLDYLSLIEPAPPKKALAALAAPKRLGGGVASAKAGARNKPPRK
jgi:hypothetical protein